ncbi:hypothetical protein JTP77_042240, partial [Streptomyces sp. S9]|nr:hypothetical protein [Streptomyces sp. S9]
MRRRAVLARLRQRGEHAVRLHRFLGLLFADRDRVERGGDTGGEQLRVVRAHRRGRGPVRAGARQ